MRAQVPTGGRKLAAAVCRSDSFTPETWAVENVVMVRAMRAMGVTTPPSICSALASRRREHCPHRIVGAGLSLLYALQVARGYSVMANGGFRVNPFFISKIENDQGGVLFEERPKIACPQCDLPVIYGDTPKSNVLENKGCGRCRHLRGTAEWQRAAAAAAGAGQPVAGRAERRTGIRAACD